MALPVTITGVSTTVAPVGPFKSSGGNYYFFGKDSVAAGIIRAYKATDPTVAFSVVASQFLTGSGPFAMSSYQVGDVIHLLCGQLVSTNTGYQYDQFNMATDTFGTSEQIITPIITTGQTGTAQYGCSLVVRSTGEVVAFFNGVQTKTSGTFYARVYYSRRTAVNTWSAGVEVDANTALDNTTPFSVLGASNRAHFFWSAGATTGYRTLSAANALNTGGSNASMTAPGDGCSYDRSGTIKVIVTSNVNAAQGTLRFDSSDNPTPTFANQSIAAATIPHRIGSDPVTDDITIVYRSSADSDLYAIKSTDDGATFGTPVSFFVGTVANADANVSRNATGGVYQRGSQIVLGYIVNDNGTLKYNEYTLRTTTTNYTLTTIVGAIALTGVANKLARSRDFNVDAGAITLTGNAANLSRGYKLTAATGAVVLAGQTAQLRVARRATTTTGAITLTGNPATLTVATTVRVLTATVGNVVLAGQAVNLRVARKAVASTGAVTLAGNAVNLRVDHRLVTASGAVVVAGQAPTLRLAHKAVATTGAVTLAGQAPTLRLAHKAVATTGAVVLAGQPVSLRVGRGLAASRGAVVLAGQPVTLRVAHKAVVTTGVVTLTGIPVTLNQGAPGKLTALAGAIVLAGQPVGLRVARRETVAKGTIALAGQSVNFRIGRGLAATSRAIVVTGQFTTLRVARKLTVTTGVVALAGTPVTLTKRGRTLEAATGAVTVTGQDVELSVGVTPYIPPPYVPYYPVSMASIMGVRRPAGTILKRFIVDVREPF